MTTNATDTRNNSIGTLPDITLADVAQQAGVSTMTVSRVVNRQAGVGKDTRERVERTIRELGYRPNSLARGLKASRSNTVGLMVPDITNPYFPEIVRGAEDVALKAGYTVFLNNVIEDPIREAATLRVFEERRVDGVLVCSPRISEAKLHGLLQRQRAAVVVDRKAPIDIAGSVRIDHTEGARLAIEHLLHLGRHRLAVLAGPARSYAGRERLRCIRTILGERALNLSDTHIVHSPPHLEGGRDAAREVLKRDPTVNGLVCFNDLVAAGALQTCARLGYAVPDNVAIVGYDDIVFASMFTPALTTLHVPTYDLGVNAMRMLLDRMESRNRQAEIILKPQLVVRASTDSSVGWSARNSGGRHR